jgi:cyclopropane fatty-acyl-phospholipid synthase-like methyltransferase
MKNSTLDYYNLNAKAFAEGTMYVDFSKNQDEFLSKLKAGDYILDFGCGAGRDTKYFLESGMKVDAIDGSKELCQIASEYTGIDVKHAYFQDLNEQGKYDGIWACASVLHLPKSELKAVLKKMSDALKSKGVMYISFKYGEFEGERNGRYFTDFTEKTFMCFVSDIDSLTVEKMWVTGDVRAGRGEEKWLNLNLRKI